MAPIVRWKEIGNHTFLQLQLCLLLSCVMRRDGQKTLDVAEKCLETMFRLCLAGSVSALRRYRAVADAVHSIHKIASIAVAYA